MADSDSETVTNDEQDADFEAGFANSPQVPTETPASDEKQPEQQSAEQVVEQAVEYVKLTKAEADELRALRATAERSFGTAFGKIGGIERQIKALTDGAQVDIDQADIDSLRSDGFEPLAKALEKVKSLRAIPVSAEAPDMEEVKLRAKKEIHMDLVDADHPDWREIVPTPEFAAWKSTLPETDQHMLDNSWNSGFINRQLNAFKASLKAKAAEAEKPKPDPASQRRARMAAAATPRASGAQPAPDQTDEFLSGFNYQRG
jgi:hypothetical protein